MRARNIFSVVQFALNITTNSYEDWGKIHLQKKVDSRFRGRFRSGFRGRRARVRNGSRLKSIAYEHGPRIIGVTIIWKRSIHDIRCKEYREERERRNSQPMSPWVIFLRMIPTTAVPHASNWYKRNSHGSEYHFPYYPPNSTWSFHPYEDPSMRGNPQNHSKFGRWHRFLLSNARILKKSRTFFDKTPPPFRHWEALSFSQRYANPSSQYWKLLFIFFCWFLRFGISRSKKR